MNQVAEIIPSDTDVRQEFLDRDQELVTAVQAGSTIALAELQARYSKRLYQTIVRITKNREDAEDALQDTFLRAFVAFSKFEGRSSVYSWWTRIAINSALMVIRKRGVRPQGFVDSAYGDCDESSALEIADDAPDPEQVCYERERHLQLVGAIRKLEPKLRKPLQVHLARGCSMQEVARTLGISVAAVKARLYRARLRLTKVRRSGREESMSRMVA